MGRALAGQGRYQAVLMPAQRAGGAAQARHYYANPDVGGLQTHPRPTRVCISACLSLPPPTFASPRSVRTADAHARAHAMAVAHGPACLDVAVAHNRPCAMAAPMAGFTWMPPPSIGRRTTSWKWALKKEDYTILGSCGIFSSRMTLPLPILEPNTEMKCPALQLNAT
jgi:hypothetical protein